MKLLGFQRKWGWGAGSREWKEIPGEGKRDGSNLGSCVTWTDGPRSTIEDRTGESKEVRQ